MDSTLVLTLLTSMMKSDRLPLAVQRWSTASHATTFFVSVGMPKVNDPSQKERSCKVSGGNG